MAQDDAWKRWRRRVADRKRDVKGVEPPSAGRYLLGCLVMLCGVVRGTRKTTARRSQSGIGSNVELTSNVADPMERCVSHVDVAGVSTRVSDAQTPEEHHLPQQSVQSVREGVIQIHLTKKHEWRAVIWRTGRGGSRPGREKMEPRSTE